MVAMLHCTRLAGLHDPHLYLKLSCLLVNVHLPQLSYKFQEVSPEFPSLRAVWHRVGIRLLFVGRMNEAANDAIL